MTAQTGNDPGRSLFNRQQRWVRRHPVLFSLISGVGVFALAFTTQLRRLDDVGRSLIFASGVASILFLFALFTATAARRRERNQQDGES